MTAETLTGNNAASDARVASPGWAHGVHAIYGKYSVAANVEDGDIFELCKIPAGFLVLSGCYYAGDIDTGTEALDMDMGWAANGSASAATFTDANDNTWTDQGYSATPTGFVNSGVLSGDGVTDLLAAGSNMRPFPMTTGPLYFDKETTVQAEANVAANSFTAAVIYVVLYGVFIKQ